MSTGAFVTCRVVDDGNCKRALVFSTPQRAEDAGAVAATLGDRAVGVVTLAKPPHNLNDNAPLDVLLGAHD